jgi:hypothetical protein
MLYDGDDLDSDGAIDDRLDELERELARMQTSGRSSSFTQSRTSQVDHVDLMEDLLQRVPFGGQRGRGRAKDRETSPGRRRIEARHPSLPPSPVLGAREMSHESSWLMRRSEPDFGRPEEYQSGPTHAPRDELRGRVIRLEQEVDELMTRLDESSAKLRSSRHECSILKETVADLERQRKSDERRIAELRISHEEDVAALNRQIEILRGTPSRTPVGAIRRVSTTPPWATHEDIVPERRRSPKIVTSPLKDLGDELAASTESTPALESELLNLHLERQDLESALGRIPAYSAGRTVAERNLKTSATERLGTVETLIGEIKRKLRERHHS